MLDTMEQVWHGERVGESELRCYRDAVIGNIRCGGVWGTGMSEDETIATSWLGQVPGLGDVRLTGDGSVRVQGSLSKHYQALCEGLDWEQTDNGRMLTHRQAETAWQAVRERVEEVMPMVRGITPVVTRADIVYDRHVDNPMGVLRVLAGGVKPTRCGMAWYANAQGVPTGLMLRGKAVVHRVYDKGIESGKRQYSGVLRSEEQVRRKAAAMSRVVDAEHMRLDRESAMDVLNDRYTDCDGEALAVDVAEMMRQRQYLVMSLVLNPDLMAMYRQTVSESTYYETKAKVRQVRAKAIPVDLRVPADAWVD